MKKLFFISIFLLGAGSLFAQDTIATEKDKESRLDFTANLQNNHLWRGLIITDMPVVMGNLSYALDEKQEWKIGIWGASSLSNDKDNTHYKEIDYYVQYNNGRLYIGLWNLFNSRNINTEKASNNIFHYGRRRTANIIDLRTNYTFGPAFPLNLEADIILFGGANSGEVVLNNDGSYHKNKYSTYIQATYPVIKNAKVDLSAFVGAGFALNDKRFLYGNENNSFDIVNVGVKASKTIKISKNYSLPVNMMAMWNPSNKYARIQLAATVF